MLQTANTPKAGTKWRVPTSLGLAHGLVKGTASGTFTMSGLGIDDEDRQDRLNLMRRQPPSAALRGSRRGIHPAWTGPTSSANAVMCDVPVPAS